MGDQQVMDGETQSLTSNSSNRTDQNADGDSRNSDSIVVRSRRVSRGSLRLFTSNDNHRDPVHHTQPSGAMDVERSNLTLLMKSIVKQLLETAMRQKRVVDFSEVPFLNFFVCLEDMMHHGLKARRSLLLVSSKDLWPVLEIVSHFIPEASDITKSARDLPNARTWIGKCRAWFRLALMQKRLADYFMLLVDKKDLLREFYDEGAFLLSEESVGVGGSFIGLNIIDCNDWCVRDAILDYQPYTIDLRYCLKNVLTPDGNDANGEENETLKEVLDQKNYLEELNRHLTSTVENLRIKIKRMEEDTFQILNDGSEEKKVQNTTGTNGESDSAVPGNNSNCDVESLKTNLESVTRVKDEMEVAMKLLEKDIHEKQDTIISLRRQLEDIKAINIQMYSKIQQLEEDLKTRDEKIVRQEQKNSSLTKNISQLESRLKVSEERRLALEESNQKHILKMQETEGRRVNIESELKAERDWRTSLKQIVDEQQEQMTKLQTELDEMRVNSAEYNKLKRDYQLLSKKCSEYELSLEEVGVQLRESKLEVDDLKESSLILKDAFWAKDEDVTDCFQCNKPFSVSRRKHHCRSCGHIFCASCSDNKLPLASAARPVRVCDTCYTHGLERYSVK